jgi:RNA polymerase sigma-70 factor (ECF subfamily)
MIYATRKINHQPWYLLPKGQCMAESRPMGVEPPASERENRWRGYLGNIARGDSQALAQLYDECAPSLLGLARRLLRNVADAEEIILDVFEQVWRTAPSFDPGRGSVWRWLTMLVKSRAVDRLRTAAVRHDRDRLSIEDHWDLASHDPLPDHTTIFDQERTLIRSALQLLPHEQRQAVELAYYSGLTHVEIASELNAPLGTIKTRIRVGMEKLRASLTRGGRPIAELTR